MNNKILIIGLGNPGKKYKGTPHNAGFDIIANLITQVKDDELKIKEVQKSYATIFEFKLNEKKVIMLKPLLFMNRSGEALKNILNFYKLQLTAYSLFIVHDDIDLPLGKIRITKDTTSSGHKGVQNIIDKVHPKNMTRIRIGVRPPYMRAKRTPEEMSKFVTKKFRGKNKKIFKKATKEAMEEIFELLQNT